MGEEREVKGGRRAVEMKGEEGKRGVGRRRECG